MRSRRLDGPVGHDRVLFFPGVLHLARHELVLLRLRLGRQRLKPVSRRPDPHASRVAESPRRASDTAVGYDLRTK
jgi:hypothetical protein